MKRLHTYSQHFLRDKNLVKLLVGHSNLKKSDTVYDIGAGSGMITSVLANYVHDVIAIEYDKRMIHKIYENTKDRTNIKIIETNFLDMELPTTPYKVFANIPFHLSSPILRKLTNAENPPESIYLIVQKQFAKKLLIGEKTEFTGLLGAMIAPWFTTRIRYRLQRTDFLPNPAVDTAMVEILLRNNFLLERDKMTEYQAFVEQCFSRQKYFSSLPSEIVRQKRPSQLTADEWVNLYQSSKRA